MTHPKERFTHKLVQYLNVGSQIKGRLFFDDAMHPPFGGWGGLNACLGGLGH